MKRPISSRVRVILALTLHETGTPATQAVDAATNLIEKLRERGFDIVHSDWVDGPVPKDIPVAWDEIASMADAIEKDFGRKPWMP